MRTINSTNWPQNEPKPHFFDKDDKDSLEEANFFRNFANACYIDRQNTIALVGDAAHVKIAQNIYDTKIKSNFFLEGQSEFFLTRTFETESDLTKYQQDPKKPFNEGQICLALEVEQWNELDE